MGDACIKNAYKKLGLSAPAGLRLVDIMSSNGDFTNDLKALYTEFLNSQPIRIRQAAASLERRQGACTENTVLFGRGTTEIGSLGTTVGPALSSGLSRARGWSVHGIDYSADLSGIYCLGMTGGLKCVDQINKLVQRCPNTNIVLSGYSQGAMVARICAAWAGDAAKKRIKVSSTFCLLICLMEPMLIYIGLGSVWRSIQWCRRKRR